jgi:Ca-activated chloride channel homolog
VRTVKKAQPAQIIVLFLLTTLAFAPRPVLPQEKKTELEHQISVSAISIAVTVQGKDGRYISDLTQDDFTVYENKAKQTITYFKHDFEAPVSLTVLLDVSGSMGLQDKLRESKEALRYLLTGLLRPQDEASLLIFADGQVEVAAKFSTDKSGFLAELDHTEAYGQTALNDAVAVSPGFANRGKNEKRAILLITDGIENDSQASVDQAVEIARRVDVPIFTIGYKIPLDEEFLRKYKRTSALTSVGIVSALERFSQATGGRVFIAAQPEELSTALREIKRELSHQYIIGYTSYKNVKNEYRRIRVETANKKFKVRTREGY